MTFKEYLEKNYDSVDIEDKYKTDVLDADGDIEVLGIYITPSEFIMEHDMPRFREGLNNWIDVQDKYDSYDDEYYVASELEEAKEEFNDEIQEQIDKLELEAEEMEEDRDDEKYEGINIDFELTRINEKINRLEANKID